MDHNNTPLTDLLNEMKSLRDAQETQSVRLRGRLERLESQRRGLYDIVVQQNSDFETRKKLEETENQLSEIQHQLLKGEADLKLNLQKIRQHIVNLRNEKLGAIEQQIKLLRQRKLEIRQDQLPAAQARVAALEEEEKTIGQQLDEFALQIRELNAIDIKTAEVA